jgi:hypothetical protein
MIGVLWRAAQANPALAIVLSMAALGVAFLGLAFWVEERRLSRIWAIEQERDRLLRERDRLWKDGV